MRILYGANSQGQGHLSKAASLIPVLEARGHDVRLITSGPALTSSGYQFRWHRHFAGLPYAVHQGQTDFQKTAWNWFKESPRTFGCLRAVRQIVREYQPDLIISDFEPLTASPLLAPRCEVLAVSRQVALLDRDLEFPAHLAKNARLARAAMRLFTLGADRFFGYHYAPTTYRCLPPVVRPEIVNSQSKRGEHLLVYAHFADSGKLVEWAAKENVPVVAYGFAAASWIEQKWVQFRKPSRQQMEMDLLSARAVITSAGFTTPLEAYLLGLPVTVVPLPNQWEQQVNAWQLEQLGIAHACHDWDYEFAWRQEAAGLNLPLRRWLSTSIDFIADRIVGQKSHSRDSTDQIDGQGIRTFDRAA